MRTRGAWLVAIGLVAAIAATGLLVTTRAGADSERERCARFREAARDRAALVTGRGEDVLVIGDSYSVGLGVRADQSWPTRLPGRVHVAGFSGSGFSAGASPCGATSYADRVMDARAYDVVVVEGGLNDFDQGAAAIRDGFARLMRRLGDRQVLVVGPPPAPERAFAVPAVDAELARLATAYGVDYLSMLDADLPYLEDELHLTPAGHREFGDLVADRLSPQAAPPGR